MQLFTDDDAVSPVIGVIMMVAITVILASVIAVFVLNVPATLESTPTANFAFDYDGDNDRLIVTHEGGERLPSENVYLRGENFDEVGDSWVDAGGDVGSNSRIVTGNSVELTHVDDDFELRVVYETPDVSNTIEQTEGPAA